jgi:hypothetical protein
MKKSSVRAAKGDRSSRAKRSGGSQSATATGTTVRDPGLLAGNWGEGGVGADAFIAALEGYNHRTTRTWRSIFI